MAEQSDAVKLNILSPGTRNRPQDICMGPYYCPCEQSSNEKYPDYHAHDTKNMPQSIFS